MYLENKDLANYRDEQLKKQNGVCSLCRNEIDPDSAALDHDHDSGHIREVLCMTCNSFEGMILHKFRRSGVHKRTDIKSYLQNVIKYWDADYSDNLIHPREKPKAPKLMKRSYNKLYKLYNKRAKIPPYPPSKKLTKKLEQLFKEYNIDIEYY